MNSKRKHLIINR